jgi:hypothetical protein
MLWTACAVYISTCFGSYCDAVRRREWLDAYLHRSPSVSLRLARPVNVLTTRLEGMRGSVGVVRLATESTFVWPCYNRGREIDGVAKGVQVNDCVVDVL